MWSSQFDVQFLWNEIFWSAYTCGISSSHTLPPRCSWLFKAFKLEPRIALPKYFARDLWFEVGWFYSASICSGVPRQISLICPFFAGWSVGRCNASVLFINFPFSQRIENLVFPTSFTKGTFQKLLSGFCPLGGGVGGTPLSAKLFWAQWLSVKGGGSTPQFR